MHIQLPPLAVGHFAKVEEDQVETGGETGNEVSDPMEERISRIEKILHRSHYEEWYIINSIHFMIPEYQVTRLPLSLWEEAWFHTTPDSLFQRSAYMNFSWIRQVKEQRHHQDELLD